MTNMFVKDLPVPHEDGSWVSEKVSRIIELIREYDSNLDVRWIPPRARKPGDAAYAIIEMTEDGWRTAFLINTEEEFDERVLARIYNGDSRVHGDITVRIDEMNRAVQALKHKEWLENLEQAQDEARFMWRTGKHQIKHNGKKLNL